MKSRFFRDVSNRLTHNRADIDSRSYREVCRKVVKHFSLKPCSEMVVGLDEMFQDFSDGTSTIELAWDNGLCFTAVAKEPDAEPLIRHIAAFLHEVLPPKLKQ